MKTYSDFCFKKFCKKRRRKKRFFIVFSSFFIVLIVIFCYLVFVVEPIIFDNSFAIVKSSLVRCYNNALFETIDSFDIYNNLFSIHYNSSNEVSAITTNSLFLNKIAISIVENCQSHLDSDLIDKISIPLGTVSGIPFLIGMGKKISIFIMPVGFVKCDFQNEFVGVGINQTLHKIYISISCEVAVYLPTKFKSILVDNSYLICENIINGKVPEFYLNSGKSYIY